MRSVVVRDWLKDKGFLTRWAHDVSHAIEELYDFTVKDRPDIVMLEATPLSESLFTLRKGLCGPGNHADFSVLAMCDKGQASRPEHFFATDFAQLEAMIDREAMPPIQYAAGRIG